MYFDLKCARLPIVSLTPSTPPSSRTMFTPSYPPTPQLIALTDRLHCSATSKTSPITPCHRSVRGMNATSSNCHLLLRLPFTLHHLPIRPPPPQDMSMRKSTRAPNYCCRPDCKGNSLTEYMLIWPAYAKQGKVPLVLSTQEVKYLMMNGCVFRSFGKDRKDWRVKVQPASCDVARML